MTSQWAGLGLSTEMVPERTVGLEGRSVVELLAMAKTLAAEYYDLTGRPLGMTGEIAEYEAAAKLGLELCSVRTPGYDAIRVTEDAYEERIQIKGRRFAGHGGSGRGRVGNINLQQPFDKVLLVLLDERFDPIEMLETPAISSRPACRPARSPETSEVRSALASSAQSPLACGRSGAFERWE